MYENLLKRKEAGSWEMVHSTKWLPHARILIKSVAWQLVPITPVQRGGDKKIPETYLAS